MNGSLLRMRPLEPGGVTLFESPLTSLQTTCSRRILELFTRALLLETLLSRHVQLRFRRQRCTARRFFSGADPIGKQIRVNSVLLTVVGVSGDAIIDSLTDPSFPEVYTVHSQGVSGASGNMVLALRTDADPLSLAAVLREQVHGLDKEQSLANIQTLEQVVNESLGRPRLNTLLLAAFAVLALLLAAIGIYGVLSYSVAQRTHEIGIRMALGAERRDVLRLIVGHGLFLTLMGITAGSAAAFGLTRLMTGLLFGVRPTDPTTFVAASVLLTCVALLASYIPARRATKVDPMVALRYE